MSNSIVTLKDIAVAAGCSPRVASAALNPTGSSVRVGAEAKQRILATAQELGYRTNELARAVATGKSRVIAAVIDDFQVEPQAWMLIGAIEAAAAQGYLVKVFPIQQTGGKRSESFKTSEIIERCVEWRLGGIVAFVIQTESSQYLSRKAKHLKLPFTLLDSVPANYHGHWVTSDDAMGIHQVVEHLVNQGHRDIGFLGGGADSISKRRELYFKEKLSEFDRPVRESWIAYGSWEHGEEIKMAARSLLEGKRPTAVVCAGDPLAMVMIGEARAAGLKVPEQLSVTGFGNLMCSPFVDPSLTTIEQSFKTMGRTAAKRLLALAEGGEPESGPVVKGQKVPTQLVIRESTMAPKG